MSKLPKANKELGQHFLRDQKVINAITTDWKEEADIIIEVGPGPAILTRKLSQHSQPLYVIEKDDRFKDTLLEYVDQENIYIGDALEFDWQGFIEKEALTNKKIWLVSNLPYNVGTILFTQFLQIPQIEYMTLMFQKEVGDKTYLRDTKNQMNGLLFLSLNYFNSRQLLKVPPGAFSPPPKVDSVVVSYHRKELPDISINNYKSLNEFTRLVFSMKRKQLQKVLKSKYSKDYIEKSLASKQELLEKRSEAISYTDILFMFQALENK